MHSEKSGIIAELHAKNTVSYDKLQRIDSIDYTLTYEQCNVSDENTKR